MSFPNSSPAANTFLVDSLISACRTDSFYSSGMYVPSTEMETYGMQTCGLLPSLGKREVSHQHMGMNVHPYVPQFDNWADPSRTSTQIPTCTFSQNIKEETNCCMYSDKRAKVSSSEIPTYADLIPESCSADGPEIPVPGYFRLSQTYASGKNKEYSNESSPSRLLPLSRVAPKSPLPSPVRVEQKISQDQKEGGTPTRPDSPDPQPSPREEKTGSTEASPSSPEPPQKETKGGYKGPGLRRPGTIKPGIKHQQP